jgi:large subunit ribosomal protein L6
MVRQTEVSYAIDVPQGVTVTLVGKKITVKGPKGTVEDDFSHARAINLDYEDNQIKIYAMFPRRKTYALAGTVRSLVTNMILGVQKGYTYLMKLVFSHFPITVEVNGRQIAIKNFIGERASRMTQSIGDVTVTPSKTEVVITGASKKHVSQTAANIQRRCNIPKKDRRVFQDGIFVYKKMLGDETTWEIR